MVRECLYLTAGGEVSLDLSAMNGRPTAKWYGPMHGEFGAEFRVTRETETMFRAPDQNDWTLLIKSK